MERHLHIISANAPWPIDNCIAIDSFYKIKALHEEGIKIHLHYFCSQPGCHPTELNQYCESIHTYTENSKTNSSAAAQLSESINKDNYPVLLEGLKCLQQLSQITSSGRIVLVRMYDNVHNKKQPGHFIARLFSRNSKNEISRQLKHLPSNCRYIFTTEEAANCFRTSNSFPAVHYLPVFGSTHSIISETGVGNYCLYHGDLSDSSNKNAAVWLMTKVFNDINTPLIVAGKNPGRQISKLADFFTHICLVTNPSMGEMDELIRKAHINILPSFGNKKPEHKLMNALQKGRHCITNEEAVSGTILSDACHVGKNAAALKSIILQLYHRPFEEDEIELRKKIFKTIIKEKPVNTLLRWIYG